MSLLQKKAVQFRELNEREINSVAGGSPGCDNATVGGTLKCNSGGCRCEFDRWNDDC